MSDGIDQEKEVTIRCPECGEEITVVIEKTHHNCEIEDYKYAGDVSKVGETE